MVNQHTGYAIPASSGIRASSSRSILVTTFEKRFFGNALPLVQELRKQMPDIPILIFINGNLGGDHDKALRSKFLKSLSEISNIDVVCNGRMTGISRNWNLGIQLASTEQVLCLSDDVLISSEFFKDVEVLFKQNELNGLTVIESFACFFISRNLIDLIGWFDERYLGFGIEDGDYLWRFENYFGFPPSRYKIDSFSHAWQSDRGDDVMGEGKYSLANFAYNDLKYINDENGLQGPYSEKKISRLSSEYIHPMEDFRRNTSKALSETDIHIVTEILSSKLALPESNY